MYSYLFVRLVAFVLCYQLVLRIQLKHRQVFAIISLFLLIVIHTLFSGDNTSFDSCYQHKSHWYMYYNCQPFDFRNPYRLSLFRTIQLPDAIANAVFRENYPINLSLFHCYSVTVLHHSFYLAIPLSVCLCLFTCIRSSHSCYRLPLILLPCSSYLSPLSGSLIHTPSLKPFSLSLLSPFIALSILGSLANHCFFYLLTHWRRTYEGRKITGYLSSSLI